MFGIRVLGTAHDVPLTLADATAPLPGTGSVAGAVVLFAACVRLLLVPLGYAQTRAEVARVRLAPQVRRIRERHGKDPQRVAREMSALHREAGTSMFAGILPALAGLPFPLATVGFVGYRRADADAPALVRWMPFGTVPTAMFVPLAAGVYLLTSTAWTTAERPLLKRVAQRRDQGVVPGH